MTKSYIKIKDICMPIVIRKYKTSNSFKIFFSKNILNITAPKFLSNKKISSLIKENEEYIYTTYQEVLKKFCCDEKSDSKIMYLGKLYPLNIVYTDFKKITLSFDEEKFILTIYKDLSQEEKYDLIEKTIKKMYKQNLKTIISKRLPFWSEKTNINYSGFRINSASKRFGSCNYNTKMINFSCKLMCCNYEAIDSVIVHELCHIIHPNHSSEYYNLLHKLFPNYDECSKWIKENVEHMI